MMKWKIWVYNLKRKHSALGYRSDVTAKNTAIASESLSVKITGKTYETKKIHT